eukprot:m51a1_g5274 hypothetical protein (494) ;mRNA; r:153597-156304
MSTLLRTGAHAQDPPREETPCSSRPAKNMSEKAQLGVSVMSLQPPDKEGWATKQGGSIKTWKKRWFILKGNRLWYFKGKTDTEAKGYIELEPTTVVRDESKKRKNMFSVQARGPKGRRMFLICPDTLPEVAEWVEAIKRNIRAEGGNNDESQSLSQQMITSEKKFLQQGSKPEPVSASPSAPVASKPDASSPRAKIAAAKAAIPFLLEEDSKVLEFWQIWSESIPPKEELAHGQSVEFLIATSADMEKLTWRTAGPQNIFIQKMVDFFWNVGAPESEIDRLNDVGALINPMKIGSWIDMSSKGGMDGGWYFPVEIPIKLAIEAADQGEPTRRVMEWVENHNVMTCFSVGRDMGAAPPRQTELRLRLPGSDFSAQLNVALEAFSSFGFPALPDGPLGLLKSHHPENLCLSIITSCEGFVRLGLLIPCPGRDFFEALVETVNGKRDAIAKFERAFGGTSPSFVEYQYLVKGFGYGVYKEGFDVVFHWQVGEEWGN